MGKVTRDETQNPFVITPEEKAKANGNGANGNGTTTPNPFVIAPSEISDIKKKIGEESAKKESQPSAAPSTEPTPSVGSASVSGSVGSEVQSPSSSVGELPPQPKFSYNDFANFSKIDGKDVNLDQVRALPGPYSNEAEAEAKQKLKDRVKYGDITDDDAKILAPILKISPEKTKDAVNYAAAYDRDKAKGTIAGDIDANISIIKSSFRPDYTPDQIKADVINGPGLKNYYRLRNAQFDQQIKQLDLQKAAFTTNTYSGSASVAGMGVGTQVISNQTKYDQLEAERKSLIEKKQQFNDAAFAVLGVQLNDQYNKPGIDGKYRSYGLPDQEAIGTKVKGVFDPLGADADTKREAAGYALPQTTKFQNAKLGLQTRLFSLAAELDDVRRQLDDPKTDKATVNTDIERFKTLANEYQSLAHQLPVLSDNYPEVRRQEQLQALSDLFHANNQEKQLLRIYKGLGDTPDIKDVWHKLFGNKIERDDAEQLSKQTGLTVDQIMDLNDQGRKFMFKGGLGLKTRQGGVYDPGLLDDTEASLVAYTTRMGNSLDRWIGTGSSIDKDVRHEADEERLKYITRLPSQSNLFQTETVPDLRRFNPDGSVNPNFMRETINDQANKFNFNTSSVIHTIADNGAQFALFAGTGELVGAGFKVAGEAIGALKGARNALDLVDLESKVAPLIADIPKANALTQRLGELSGIYGSSFAMGHDQYYREASQFTNDPEKKMWYAVNMANWDALGELILPETDIAKAMAGKKQLFKMFDRAFTEAGGKWTESAATKFLKAAATAGYVSTKEGAEEVLTAMGQAYTKPFFNGQPVDVNAMRQDAIQSFTSVAIGMLPNAVGAGVGSTSKMTKDALFEVGNAPSIYNDYVAKQLNAGKIDKKEADKRIQTINTMADIVKNIPTHDVNGEPLNDAQKVELAAQEFRIRRNNAIINANGIAAAVKAAEADNAEAQNAQANILNQAEALKRREELKGKDLDEDEPSLSRAESKELQDLEKQFPPSQFPYRWSLASPTKTMFDNIEKNTKEIEGYGYTGDALDKIKHDYNVGTTLLKDQKNKTLADAYMHITEGKDRKDWTPAEAALVRRVDELLSNHYKTSQNEPEGRQQQNPNATGGTGQVGTQSSNGTASTQTTGGTGETRQEPAESTTGTTTAGGKLQVRVTSGEGGESGKVSPSADQDREGLANLLRDKVSASEIEDLRNAASKLKNAKPWNGSLTPKGLAQAYFDTKADEPNSEFAQQIEAFISKNKTDQEEIDLEATLPEGAPKVSEATANARDALKAKLKEKLAEKTEPKEKDYSGLVGKTIPSQNVYNEKGGLIDTHPQMKVISIGNFMNGDGRYVVGIKTDQGVVTPNVIDARIKGTDLEKLVTEKPTNETTEKSTAVNEQAGKPATETKPAEAGPGENVQPGEKGQKQFRGVRPTESEVIGAEEVHARHKVENAKTVDEVLKNKEATRGDLYDEYFGGDTQYDYYEEYRREHDQLSKSIETAKREKDNAEVKKLQGLRKQLDDIDYRVKEAQAIKQREFLADLVDKILDKEFNDYNYEVTSQDEVDRLTELTEEELRDHSGKDDLATSLIDYIAREHIQQEKYAKEEAAAEEAERKSQQDVISQAETAIKETERVRPNEEEAALDQIEAAIDAINKKVKNITEVYSTEGIAHELPNIPIGKKIAVELRSIAKVIATNFGWTVDKVYPNVAPAGGEVWVAMSFTSNGEKIQVQLAAEYSPEYTAGGGYDDYQFKDFRFKVVPENKNLVDPKTGNKISISDNHVSFDLTTLIKRLGEVAKRFPSSKIESNAKNVRGDQGQLPEKGSPTQKGKNDRGEDLQQVPPGSSERTEAQQQEGSEIKLPADLAGATPKYAYGPKQFNLNFESDIDRAAYITAQDTPSKRDKDYIKFVKDALVAATGDPMARTMFDDKLIRAYGKRIKENIKQLAKEGKNGDTLTVPTTILKREVIKEFKDEINRTKKPEQEKPVPEEKKPSGPQIIVAGSESTTKAQEEIKAGIKEKFGDQATAIEDATKALFAKMKQKGSSELAPNEDLLAEAKELASKSDGIFQSVIARDPEKGLFYVAQQLNEPGAAESTHRSVGDRLAEIALQLYPSARVGDVGNARLDEQTENGKARMNTIATSEGEMPVEEYIARAKAVLRTLFPNAKLEEYQTTADYVKAGATFGSRGYFIPGKNGEHRVLLNLDAIRRAHDGETAFHEVIHPIVFGAIGTQPHELIPIWNELADVMKDVPAMQDIIRFASQYDATDVAAEGLTEFLTKVANGTIPIEQIRQPSVLARIIELINKLFKALGIDFQINSVKDFKGFAEKVKNAFTTGDVKDLRKLISQKRIDHAMAAAEMDPEMFNMASNLLSMYKQKGVTKFDDIVNNTRQIVGDEDALNPELLDTLRGLYSYYRGKLPREERKNFSSDEDIDDFIDNIQSITNGDTITSDTAGGTETEIHGGVPPGGPETTVQGGGTEKLPGRGGTAGIHQNSGSGKGRSTAGHGGGANIGSGSNTGSSGGGGTTGTTGEGEGTEGNVGQPAIRKRPAENSPERNLQLKFPSQLVSATDGVIGKVRANMDALLLLRRLEAEDRNATPEEKITLAQWVGWGGVSKYLDAPNSSLATSIFTGEKTTQGYSRERTIISPNKVETEGKTFDQIVKAFQEEVKRLKYEYPDALRYSQVGETLDDARKQVIKNLLSEDEYMAATKSTNNAHYTSASVVQAMWDFAKHLGFQGGTILESASGIGHFFAFMPKDIADRSNSIGVELDDITGRLLKKLYPENEIYQKGFQEVNMIPNSVDLAITNVPFGQKGELFDSKNPDISKFNLHNYFIAKNLKLLKPGGLHIVISSNSTMDNPDGEARRWFTDGKGGNSDFIGAIRLPNNAFDKNAGTQVTTDILVFRKRTNEAAFTQPYTLTPVIRAEIYKDKDGNDQLAEIPLNEYYVDHPENMIGEMKFAKEVGAGGLYSSMDPTLHLQGATEEKVIDQLNKIYKTFPANIFKKADIAPENESISTSIKEGKIFEQNGKVYESVGDSAVPVDFSETGGRENVANKEKRAKAYIKLRDKIYPLLNAEISETATDEEIEKLRKDLNKEYDNFVSKFGPIALDANKHVLSNIDVDYPLAVSLEDVKQTAEPDPKTGKLKKKESVTKGDLLNQRVNYPRIDPTTAESYEDAIQISLAYKGIVSPDYIAKLMGTDAETAKKELLEKDLVFENPKSGILEIPDYYLSGPVRTKLDEAKEAAKNDIKFQRNVTALEKVIPPDILSATIKFDIGVSYLPGVIYKSFAQDVLGVDARFEWVPERSQWEINSQGNRDDARNQQTYGVQPYYDGYQILKAVMQNKRLKAWDPDPADRKKRILNIPQTEAVEAMQKRMNEEFERYVKSNDEFRGMLEEGFNKIANNDVNKKISKPPFKHFPGASHVINLMAHQMTGAIRAVLGNTLFAHEVGTGKTFLNITAAMEMRRLKTARKPMIVVHNSTLEQYRNSFKKLYPTAKVLILSSDELTADTRKKFFARMATGDWDAIVLPHSQLDFIPDKPARVMQFIREKIQELQDLVADQGTEWYIREQAQKDIENLDDELDNLLMGEQEVKAHKKAIEQAGEEAAKKSKGSKGAKSKAKKEGKRLAKLKARVDRMVSRSTDQIIDFDDMGVDALFIDESHKYKKLGFQSNIQKVKGIDKDFSKRAVSLKLKTQAVMEKTGGRNVHFSTGTPVTNTLAEAWTNMRFLVPERVKELGITSFDQFQKFFTSIEDSVEQNAGGTFQAMERLSSFNNQNQLKKIFMSFTDTITVDDIPELKEKQAIPVLATGGPRPILVPISPALKDMMYSIKSAYDAYTSLRGREKRARKWVPGVLYNIGRMATVDQRLVNPSLQDDPGSKANAAVKEIIQLYKDYDQHKATQFVFSDFISSHQAPRVMELMHLQPVEKQFNLYQDIKDKLIKGGIPAHEIALMTEPRFGDAKARQRLWDAVKSGEVRVVIGSTDKMGVGVDASERMIGLHHLNLPDRPDQFQQREGRMIRQGNLFAQLKIPVHELVYGLQGTSDSTAAGRLSMKAKGVLQLFAGKINDNEVSDLAAEDNTASDIEDWFAEMGAALTGNKDHLNLVLTNKKLKKEENREFVATQKLRDAELRLRNQQKGLIELELKIKKAGEIEAYTKENFPDGKVTSITIDEETVTEKLADVLDAKVIDPLIKRAKQEASDSGEEKHVHQGIKIGNSDARIYVGAIKTNQGMATRLFVQVPSIGLGMRETDEYAHWQGWGREIDSESAKGLLAVVNNQLKKLDQVERWQRLKAATEKNIEQLKKDLQDKFDPTELNKLRADKDRLERAILASSGGRYLVKQLSGSSMYYIKDVVGDIEYHDENEPKYFDKKEEAEVAAQNLNRDYEANLETTRFIVSKGEGSHSFAVLDRTENTSSMDFGSYDVARAAADLFNDRFYGNISAKYSVYPVATMPTFVTSGSIVLGRRVEDNDNPSGYGWQVDDYYKKFDTFKSALAEADRLNTGGPNKGGGGENQEPGKRPGDPLRRYKFKIGPAAYSTILPLPQIWNGAVELVAKAMDAGVAVIDAFRKGYDWLRRHPDLQEPGQWDPSQYDKEMMSALKNRGYFQYNLSAKQMNEADKIVRNVSKGGSLIDQVEKIEKKYTDVADDMKQKGAAQADVDKFMASFDELKRYIMDGLTAAYFEEEANKVDLNLEAQTRWEKIKENIQNRYQRLEQTQRQITKANISIDEKNDFISRADRWKAIAEAAIQKELAKVGLSDVDMFIWKGQQKISGSLFDQMNKENIDYRQFNLYLYALHAPEFNKHIADIRREKLAARIAQLYIDYDVADQAGDRSLMTRYSNEIKLLEEYLKAYADPTIPRDYVKHMENRIDKRLHLMDDGGSGMTNEQAKEIVDEVVADALDVKFEPFRQAVRDIVNRSLDLQLEYGMITLDQHQLLSTYYSNYVPLKVDDKYFEDMEKSRTYASSNLPGSTIFRSKGADYITFEDRINPMTQAIVHMQATIYDGEQNKYFQTIAEAIRSAPDDKVWHLESAMMEAIKDKNGKTVRLKEKTPPKNGIPFMDEGHKKYLVINDDALYKAITEKNVKAAIPILAKINTFMRAFATVYNPNFTISNIIRDMQAAGVVLNATQQAELVKQFRKNRLQIFSIIRGAMKASGDKADLEANKTYWEKVAKEYEAEGGNMSWFKPEIAHEIIKTIEEHYEKYKQQPKTNGVGSASFKKLGIGLFDLANRVNNSIEQSTRLAIYDAAKKSGMEIHSAVQLARNATINFNKKGNWGSLIDSFYLFANANIQGTANVMKTMLMTKKGRILAGYVALAGLFQSLINNFLSDCEDAAHPEDCYDNEKDYVKERYMLIKNPFGHGFFKLPLAYGFNVFYNIGEQLGQIMHGKSTAGSASLNMTAQLINAFNPLGQSVPRDSKDVPRWLAQEVTPTAGDPIINFAINKNNLGQKIYNDFEFDRRPDSQKGYEPKDFVQKKSDAFAKWLNSESGGNDKIAGAIDVSPGTMEFVWETALGGLGQFINQLATTSESLLHGDVKDVEIKQIPIVNRFYDKPDVHSDRGMIYDDLESSYNKVLSPEKRQAWSAELDKAVKLGEIDADKAKTYINLMNRNQFEVTHPDVYKFMERTKTETLPPQDIVDFEMSILNYIQAGDIPYGELRNYKTEISKNQNSIKK